MLVQISIYDLLLQVDLVSKRGKSSKTGTDIAKKVRPRRQLLTLIFESVVYGTRKGGNIDLERLKSLLEKVSHTFQTCDHEYENSNFFCVFSWGSLLNMVSWSAQMLWILT